MTRALLILNSDYDRRRAKGWIDTAPPQTRVEFKAKRRNSDQNALMWARLSEVASQVEWYGQKLSAEDWKDVFSASLRKARVVPGIDGGTFVPLGMRTSDFTKEEMSNMLDLIDAFGAQHGVVFRDGEHTKHKSDDQSPTLSSDEGDEPPSTPSSPSTYTEADSSRVDASDEGGGDPPKPSPSISQAAVTKAVELMRYVKFLRDDIPGGLDDAEAAITELNTKAKGRFEESDFPALSKIKGWCIDAIKGDCEIEQVAEMAGEMFGVPVEQFEKKETD